MALTAKGEAVLKAFEGRALRAYRDPVGIWTIGDGITNAAKWAVEYLGRPIGPGMTITNEQAEYLFKETYRRSYEPAVARALGALAPDNVKDAAGSFHWNTGAIGRASWVKNWRASGATAAVHAGLRSWSKAGGREFKGLVRRREREWAMIARGDYGPEGVIRAEGTPGMLRIGSTGPEVEDVNGDLIALGFEVEKGDRFTPKTYAAVLAFQKAHPQLASDGIVGPATRAALNRESDAKRKITNAATSTGGTGGTTVAVDQLAGGWLPVWAYVVIGVAIVGAVGWYAWKYRDEVAGIVKRAASKE